MGDDTSKAFERIQAAIQDLRSALSERVMSLEKTLREGSGDVHSKVAARKKIIEQLQLDQKITEIFQEIQYYPTWSEKDDWLEHRLCEIDDPKGEKREKESDVSFLLNGQAYLLKYFDKGGTTEFGPNYFHHASLSLKDASYTVLIEISISVDYDSSTRLRPFDVEAFVPGPWIQDFLECYERFQANKKAREIREMYNQAKVKELKDKFGLE